MSLIPIPIVTSWGSERTPRSNCPRKTSEVVAPLTQRLVNVDPGLWDTVRLNSRATYPPSLAPTPAPVESPKATYLIGPVIESLNLLRELCESFGAGPPFSAGCSLVLQPGIKTNKPSVPPARMSIRILCIVQPLVLSRAGLVLWS
jgi:hypothetical protein